MISTPNAIAALFVITGLAATGASARTATRTDAALRAAAAHVTTREANAMQARAVAAHGANAALSNPYIEQKVTTPESIGFNPSHVPAGGF